MATPASPEAAAAVPLTVYWQPGCTSCARTKTFLAERGIPFVSVNVLADADGFRALSELGLRRVPIVRRGREWVDGQILTDVARIAGVPWTDGPPLAPPALAAAADAVLADTSAVAARLSEATLDRVFPDRPRSYRQLVAHIAQIAEAFLDLVEHDKAVWMGVYDQDVPAGMTTGADLVAYVDAVRARFAAWWARAGAATDYTAPAALYYGEQDLHAFMGRTVWHCEDHNRQLHTAVGA